MFTMIDRTIKVTDESTVSESDQCPAQVYDAWIEAVHKNKTHVNAGDRYWWLYVQLLPPKLINCVITVKQGDQYPV